MTKEEALVIINDEIDSALVNSDLSREVRIAYRNGFLKGGFLIFDQMQAEIKTLQDALAVAEQGREKYRRLAGVLETENARLREAIGLAIEQMDLWRDESAKDILKKALEQ